MILKTLDNALNLLRLFTSEKNAWGVRELAKELGISHTIVYRILSTFEKHGILMQNLETNKYQLGLRLLEYGMIIQESFSISDIIKPLMKKLAMETQETVFLTWLDGFEGVCLEIAESTQKVKLTTSLGSRTPLYGGAWGKAIMAYLPDEMLEAILKQGIKPLTSRTITSPEMLLENLREIREKGWCYSVGEYSENVAGVAAPLFNSKNQVIASLTVAGPDYRIGPEKVDFIVSHLIECRDEIQKYLQNVNIVYNSDPANQSWDNPTSTST